MGLFEGRGTTKVEPAPIIIIDSQQRGIPLKILSFLTMGNDWLLSTLKGFGLYRAGST